MKTLYDFTTRQILDNLNTAAEKIAILEAAGVHTLAGVYVKAARQLLLTRVITDVAVEPLQEAVIRPEPVDDLDPSVPIVAGQRPPEVSAALAATDDVTV